MIDFELSMIQAIRTEFPSSHIRGCLFHFCQCLWRKVQALGLTVQYRESSLLRTVVRLHMSLAFLPVHEIRPVFEVLNREVRAILPQLTPFCEYFQTQWVQNRDTGPHMWCVHKQTVRTNNDMEGWHYAMTRAIPSRHPDIFSFIKWMKDEEIYSRNICSQLDMGQISVKGGNKIYKDIAKRIEAITTSFVNGECPRSAFLRGCTYNLGELPRMNGDQAPQYEHEILGNNELFRWHLLDNIEILHVADRQMWRPWL